MMMPIKRLGLVLAMGLATAAGLAQGGGDAAQQPNAATEARRVADECRLPTSEDVKLYAMKNVTQPNDGNEIQTALRNVLPPTTHIFFVASQNAIYVCGPAPVQAVAERMVKELDKPRNRYRLTYTFTETDGGKRVGTQHYSMLVTAGQRMTVKEGSRVPIATGTYTPGGASTVQTQYQYIDVGLNFEVTLMETAAGALVKTKVEESSMVPSSNPMGPVIRQVSFEGSPTVVLGKPAIVTSLDMPESTRHVDVDVVVEGVL